ncbi:hypothetical protein [Paracoccus laeviglucosivorans]|uniref:Uncharacterized protein n=1 Tax=Paracoccus laeviglucosivorans TaxID=1197861 RepID=A0A521FUV2_9RHOB|nr:hypothetical protein [Paracoccus laeviglucosivorans]SMO99958.1 hypothetical protein SAMN06265221_1533 [Paracoccus laeviglucosivorans]
MTAHRKRIATPLGPVSESDVQIWNYKWDNGEISTVEIPAGITFDPKQPIPVLQALHLSVPGS